MQIALFFWLWGAFCYFSHGPSWGPLSRLGLVMAMSDDGTVVVDPYRTMTGDNGQYKGHFYHAKAPGGAFLGILPYRGFRLLQRRPPFEPWNAWSRYVGRAQYAVTCFGPALLSALAGVMLLRLGWEMFGRLSAAFGAVALYAFATNVFIYAAFFEAHQMAGALLAIALYLCWRGRWTSGSRQIWCLLGAGLAAGFALAAEFQDLFIVLALATYLALVLPKRRRMVWVVPAALPPLVLVMLHNWAAFDSPFSFGYAHQWGGWEALHQGPLLGFGPPRPGVLLQMLFGSRIGLFLYTPAVALAVLGGVLWRRAATGAPGPLPSGPARPDETGRGTRGLRAELVLASAVCALFPVYLSGFANALIGAQFGPRFLVVLMPFACVLMVPAVIRAPRLCAVVGVVSGLLVLAGAAVCPEVTRSPAPPIIDRVLLPFFAGEFPQSVYGGVDWRCPQPIDYRPFNLGMVMGLRSHASLVPYLAWWLIGFFGIHRLARGTPREVGARSP